MNGSDEYSIEKIDDGKKLIRKDSTFYLNTYWVREEKTDEESKADDYHRRFLYRTIYDNFTDLMILLVDIDKYLRLPDQISIENDIANSIIQMTKSYYAESKLAYDTQAIFWNVYNSGVGYKALEEIRKIDF